MDLRADHLIDHGHPDPPLQTLLEHEVAVLSFRMGHWNRNVFTTRTKFTDLKVSQDVHLCIRVSGATSKYRGGRINGRKGTRKRRGKRGKERERERERERFTLSKRDERDAYPVESNTAVFSERTGLGVNLDGGKGDAERISFLPGVGDLKDKAKEQNKPSLTILLLIQKLHNHTFWGQTLC